MKYEIYYYFGKENDSYECMDSYEMEKVIAFMKEKWNMIPYKIEALVEEKEDSPNGD